MRSSAVIFAVGFMLLFAGGCGPSRLYKGPQRPAAEVALLDLRPRGHGDFVLARAHWLAPNFIVMEVDDRDVEFIRYVELLPGPHKLRMNYHAGKMFNRYWASLDLEFTAKKGKEYVVMAASETDTDGPHRVGGVVVDKAKWYARSAQVSVVNSPGPPSVSSKICSKEVSSESV